MVPGGYLVLAICSSLPGLHRFSLAPRTVFMSLYLYKVSELYSRYASLRYFLFKLNAYLFIIDIRNNNN